mmetsp:Transcript_28117/g.24849  ORF Transcript_28117/g.24849 Transcript_28117/m.24849 type:complete len:170 (+) Transcript_28117:179-688(+)
MNSDDLNDIKAEPTLTELIDNNRRILESKVEPKHREEFVRMLRRNPREKFVNLLRALTVCDGKAMKKSQEDLSKQILEDQKVRDQLIYKLRINNNRIEIRVRDFETAELNIDVNEYWVSLDNFIDDSRANDNINRTEDREGEAYKYFISMVYLLSDLCLDRNYRAINIL